MVLPSARMPSSSWCRCFANTSSSRAYQAIVPGRVEAQTFASHLVRDRGDGRRGSTTLPAWASRLLRTSGRWSSHEYTLLECRLETGRTHQIRIHLAEAGHPVCGERVYDQPLFRRPCPTRAGATGKRCTRRNLALNHPITGEPLRFDMPLPADMPRLLLR